MIKKLRELPTYGMNLTAEGMRIVIEVRKDANANVLLNNLYKHTALQTSFGINILALVDGQPKVLNLKTVFSALFRSSKGGYSPTNRI